jgi:hypothetical protein
MMIVLITSSCRLASFLCFNRHHYDEEDAGDHDCGHEMRRVIMISGNLGNCLPRRKKRSWINCLTYTDSGRKQERFFKSLVQIPSFRMIKEDTIFEMTYETAKSSHLANQHRSIEPPECSSFFFRRHLLTSRKSDWRTYRSAIPHLFYISFSIESTLNLCQAKKKVMTHGI